MSKQVIWSLLSEGDFARILEYLSLYYREDKTKVDILRIFDTRQDPDTFTFK